LRSIKSGSNLLLLRTNMSAGHAGASGRYESIRELALEYAFILGRLVPPPRPSSAEGPVSGGEK
jgi:oligopeptidase B